MRYPPAGTRTISSFSMPRFRTYSPHVAARCAPSVPDVAIATHSVLSRTSLHACSIFDMIRLPVPCGPPSSDQLVAELLQTVLRKPVQPFLGHLCRIEDN